METTVYSNNRGFTLIEFLVAVVILVVGLLGLLQAVNYAIVHNMVNQLRQTAMVLGDERMNQEKAKPFDDIQAPVVTKDAPSRLVNGAYRNYSVVQTNSVLTSQTKNINIQVIWRHKGVRYEHSIASLVSQAQQ